MTNISDRDYILITNFMHSSLFIHKILFSSTCFEPQVLIFRRIQLYTCSIWYCHSLWEFLVACRYTDSSCAPDRPPGKNWLYNCRLRTAYTLVLSKSASNLRIVAMFINADYFIWAYNVEVFLWSVGNRHHSQFQQLISQILSIRHAVTTDFRKLSSRLLSSGCPPVTWR